jgi:hypothetical protein
MPTQKIIFTIPNFDIDKKVTFGIVDLTILLRFLIPEGVMVGERPLKFQFQIVP